MFVCPTIHCRSPGSPSPLTTVSAATSTTNLHPSFDLHDPTAFLYLYHLHDLKQNSIATPAQREELYYLENALRNTIADDTAHFQDVALLPLPQLLRRFGPMFAASSAKARSASNP